MKFFLVALSLVTVAVFNPSLADGDDRIQGDLSVAIVVGKDVSGSPVINRAGKFQVLFTNQSKKPIRLWSEWCQLGYETLSFRVEDGDGPFSLMYKRTQHTSSWKNYPPKTIAIPPGGTFSWDVAPSALWGKRVWKGAPEPNSGKLITLTAVFEIKPTEAAREHGVWTGRVTSKPIKTLVVDAKLRTPQDYLRADCPKQALRIIQADRTWIQKESMGGTPLYVAGRYGFVGVARWLLSHGADVTPLVFTRHPEIVKLLLEYKAGVNAKNSSGRTALEEAASNFAHFSRFPDTAVERDESRTITKMLLDAGAEYDIRSACLLGDVQRVRVLVADKKQARDKKAMRSAAAYGRVKIVKLLLEHGADPENTDYGGLTVSYFAIEHGDVLKLLFDAGADPKVRIEYHGNGQGPQGSTLLHEAAEKGIIESAKLLLAKGIDVDLKSGWGTTPLHEACRNGHAAMADWLLRNKADAKARTKDGWTPMSLAAREVRPVEEEDNAKRQAVIRVLERAGVQLDVFAAIACNDVQRVVSILRTDPNAGEAKHPDGRPALHRAVTLDRIEIVKLLLEHGSDPDVRSQDESSGYEDETALLQAAFWNRLEIAEMLIDSGAKVNAKADDGVVPLHEAARMKHVELARLLLRHGADVNATDDYGTTPLDWAGAYGESPKMFALLRNHGGM